MRRLAILMICALLACAAVVTGANAGSYCGAKGDWRSEMIPDRWPPPKVRQGWVAKLGHIDIVPVFKACKKHDDCYDKPGISRRECDNRFLADMRAECEKTYQNILETPLKEACYQAAQGYYQAVDKFGGPAFAAARAGKAASSDQGDSSRINKPSGSSAGGGNGKAKDAGPGLVELKAWGKIEGGKGIAAMHGKIYAYKPDTHEIWASPLDQCRWELFCQAPPATLFAAGQGRLYLWDKQSGEFFSTHINKIKWQSLGKLEDVDSFAYCGHQLVCCLVGSGDLMAAPIWKLNWQKIGALPEPSVITSFGGKIYALSEEDHVLSQTHLNKMAWKAEAKLSRFGPPAVNAGQVFVLDQASGEVLK